MEGASGSWSMLGAEMRWMVRACVAWSVEWWDDECVWAMPYRGKYGVAILVG